MAIQIIRKYAGIQWKDPWWIQWGHEMGELAIQFPNLVARRIRRNSGRDEWDIVGPYQGVKKFRDMAALAAEKLGIKAGYNSRVQYWLDEMWGDHILKKSKPRTNIDDVDFLVELNDADQTKMMFRGKQRVN